MTRNERLIVDTVSRRVREFCGNDASGHDWFHVRRVVDMARHLSRGVDADGFLVEMIALLHDVDDDKVRAPGSGVHDNANRMLDGLEIPGTVTERILSSAASIAFKGGFNSPPPCREAEIVQDADKLDALGAIGLARLFAYKGHTGEPMHDPDIPPKTHPDYASYRAKSTAVNHMYEKLFKLKDMLHSDEARRIAGERHVFMETFLREFLAEWSGKQ